MLLQYKTVKNDSVFRSLTGFDMAEFEKLLPLFEKEWNKYIEDTFVKGKKRIRAYGGGRRANLRTAADKLFLSFFILKYILFGRLPLLFSGMSQSQANVRVRRLAEVLRRTLSERKFLPERNPEKLAETLKNCPGLSFIIDAAGRKIQRPSDPEKQKIFYSGKKKTHTVRNNVIADAVSRKAVWLSRTCEGRKHDKKNLR